MPLRKYRAFAAAYAQARYVVRLPRGELILRAGVRDVRAERRLQQEAGTGKNWVLLSAANPRSRPLDESWNTQRFNQLKRLLGSGRYRLFHSISRDPQHRWPDEPGLLVVGISAQKSATIGRHFGQNALLSGGAGRAPKIVWL